MNILDFTYPLSALLAFGLALGLGMYLTRRFNLGWRLFWIGAGGFVLSQVGHIPFNIMVSQLMLRGVLPMPAPQHQLVFSAVFGGLSAGLWEEWVRYAVFRFWAKDARSWRKGVLLGAGHGGIEAMIVAGLILYSFIQLTALRGADLPALMSAERAAQVGGVLDQYWSAAWYDSLLGALERLFTLPSQVAFAVLVLQAFTRGGLRWVWAAVAWHALLDALVVYVVRTQNVYAAEAVVGAFALASLGLIFALQQPEPEQDEQAISGPPAPLPPQVLPKIEETLENLERTRYQ